MIYVLDGELDVGFPQTGVSTRVRKGDYIQFHAERPHYLQTPLKVLNEAGLVVDNPTTRIVVIRFFQFRTTSHRAAIRRMLLNWGGVRTTKGPSADLLRQEVKWLVTFNHIGTPPTGKRVLDFHGLSRLAVMLSSDSYRRSGISKPQRKVTEEELESRAKSLGAKSSDPVDGDFLLNRCTRSLFEAIHNGDWGEWRIEKTNKARSEYPKESGLDKRQLALLAGVYGEPVDVSPMLFYEFLFPAERGAVVVSRNDWFDMSEELQPPGVVYRIPRRRLALSDAAIFEVRFARARKGQKAATLVNRHPGSELCICLEGSVNVVVDKNTHTLKKDCFIHFESSKQHYVSSKSSECSRVLVVRFYGDERLNRKAP
jgi:quercetin dioxygenase-like cupin family protein